ncbi:TetR/AcrR family transcriptional regulator [Steroidobacter flavus]|uniref:TetR/AcrR family transcriptional regulator n=1 Tax=Steroidobacter flavus TaxID=1842136 RepID=A0ABV8T7N2_9GAMM
MNSVRRGGPRKRDPEGTRDAILDAARHVLARDGKEGLSVAQVANLAKVNRGTAYQHFQTREQLIEATTEWVSDKMYRAAFGDEGITSTGPVSSENVEKVISGLCSFAMENFELGRIWLYELLASRRPTKDKFWRYYKEIMARFAETDYAQKDIDVEVHSVLVLSGMFLWPVWIRAQARTAKERQEMSERFTHEMLRLALYGNLRAEKFPELRAKFSKLASAG